MNEPGLLNAATDLEHLPFESVVSSLWRFAWRNVLSPRHLINYCSRTPYFPATGANTLSKNFDPDVFEAASGWKLPIEEKFYGLGEPTGGSIWWHRTLRYCPLCLEHGYHSLWHQSRFLESCPVDGAVLKAECYWCKKPCPDYGFTRALFDRPYQCPHCHRPIAGPLVTVESRRAYQERTDAIEGALLPIDSWWRNHTPVRVQLERMISRRSTHDFYQWTRPDRSLRAWLCQSSPPPAVVICPKVPRLEHLGWKVRKRWVDLERARAPARQRVDGSVANTVYRATLIHLQRSIHERYPFTETDYLRHLRLPGIDLHRIRSRYNPHLHALCLMRRQLESTFSRWSCDARRSSLSELPWFAGSPYSEALTIRIYWRAHFLALYAVSYWRAAAARRGLGDTEVLEDSYSGDVLGFVETNVDDATYLTVEGLVAFPAVDGLSLSRLRRKSTVAGLQASPGGSDGQ